MGLARSAIAYLMDEALRRPFQGRVLTLGVQGVTITEREIEELARERGLPLAPLPDGPMKPPLVLGNASAQYLLYRLGFDDVVQTDVSDFEDADLLFDLNDPVIPAEHAGRYDLVLDSGTLEHVFHLPNALKNLLDFAALDGRVIHLSPSSNHIDHGFYMFSPTFFWDFYSANDQRIIRSDLFRYDFKASARERWLYGAYRPGSLAKYSFGGLGPGCFGVAVVVEKAAEIETLKIPQQGMYVGAWAAAGQAAPSSRPVAAPGPLAQLRKSWSQWLRRRVPVGLRLAWRAARRGFPLSPGRWL